MISVRALGAADYVDWRPLWDGYCAFYRARVPELATAATWAAAIDPDKPIWGRVACLDDGKLAGFSLSVVHPTTWKSEPSCYLEDLFVVQEARGMGIGRALIEDLLTLTQKRGYSRLYWHTHADNAAARRLYDRYGQADGFVRYQLEL